MVFARLAQQTTTNNHSDEDKTISTNTSNDNKDNNTNNSNETTNNNNTNDTNEHSHEQEEEEEKTQESEESESEKGKDVMDEKHTGAKKQQTTSTPCEVRASDHCTRTSRAHTGEI